MSLRSRVGPLDRAAVVRLSVGAVLAGATFAALMLAAPLLSLTVRIPIAALVGIAGGCYVVWATLAGWARRGGLSAVRETGAALRSGALPAPADEAVWVPRLQEIAARPSFWGLLVVVVVLDGISTVLQVTAGDAEAMWRSALATGIFLVLAVAAVRRAWVERPAARALLGRLLVPTELAEPTETQRPH